MRTFFIGLLPLVIVLGNSMFIPLIPTIEDDLRLTVEESGYFLTIFTIPAAILIPLSGLLSDRYGRKTFALASLVLIMVGCLISSLFRSHYEWVLVGRFLQGCGAGGVAPLAMTFVADLYDGERRNRAFAAIELFNGIGKVISPLLGSIALLYAWETSYLILFSVALFAFIGIETFIPNRRVSMTENESFRVKYKRGKKLFSDHWRWLVPIFISGAIGMFLLFGYLYYLSHAFASVLNGIVLTIPLLVFTVSTYRTGKALKEHEDSYKRGIVYGFALMLIATLSMIFSIDTIFMIVSTVAFAIGFGILLPSANAALASLVSKKERGLMFSLYSMCRFFGVAFSPVFFGISMQAPLEMAFSSFFFVSFIGLIIAYSWNCFPIGKHCLSHEDLY